MMRRRWVRLLLALLCVPIVVFSNPATASASTTGILKFSFDGVAIKDYGVGWADCQVSWTRSTTGIVLSPTSRCDGGPDLTPGTCQAFEAGCGSYGFVVKDVAGQTCGSTPMGNRAAPGNGVNAIRVYLTGGFVALADPDCVPAEACLSYYWDGFGPGARDSVSCAPVSIDTPEPVPTECEYGTPTAEMKWQEIEPENDYVSRWEMRVKINGVPIGSGAGSTAKGWNFGYWVVDNSVAGPYHFTNAFQYETFANPKVYTFRVSRNPDGTSKQPDWQVWGVEMYYMPGQGTDETNQAHWNKVIGGSQHSAQANYAAYDIPVSDGMNFGGLTDPGRCRFYFGKQLVEIPGTDMDIPGGTLNETTPEPEEPEVPPEPEEPDPERSNWLYLIYVVLTKIFGAISNLAQSIVDGIVDGITGLFSGMFVPAHGFFDDQFERLADSYDDTSPALYLDALGNLTPSAGGSAGCAGPTVTLPLAGTTRSFQPLDACSDGMATAAQMSRLLATVGLMIFGALACVRAVGSGLGWNPAIGQGGEK